MYSGYPQLAFNFSKNFSACTHAQKFARQGNTEIMSTFFNIIQHHYFLPSRPSAKFRPNRSGIGGDIGEILFIIRLITYRPKYRLQADIALLHRTLCRLDKA